MPLYHPPLLLKSKKDLGVQLEIKDAIKGLEHSYFYTGRRIGKSGYIELDVCTVIIDSEENVYLRSCIYSGQKDTWKEVISNQLIQHLKDIGVERDIIRSETRYFEVSTDRHLTMEKYESKILDLIAKIKSNPL